MKPPELPSGRAAKPLLMAHGWPGSFYEFYGIIPLLTDPKNHGLSDEHVFEVICPSIPGYGFSEASSKKGMGAAGGCVIYPLPCWGQVFPPGSGWGRGRGVWDSFFQDLRGLGKGPETEGKQARRGEHLYYATCPRGLKGGVGARLARAMVMAVRCWLRSPDSYVITQGQVHIWALDWSRAARLTSPTRPVGPQKLPRAGLSPPSLTLTARLSTPSTEAGTRRPASRTQDSFPPPRSCSYLTWSTGRYRISQDTRRVQGVTSPRLSPLFLSQPGLDTVATARIFYKLMLRLGFQEFYVQGGDWGSAICTNMGQLAPR